MSLKKRNAKTKECADILKNEFEEKELNFKRFDYLKQLIDYNLEKKY